MIQRRRNQLFKLIRFIIVFNFQQSNLYVDYKLKNKTGIPVPI